MALPASPFESTRQVHVADAFERLFRAEYSTVVAIATRVLADSHEAEDVAQEVFTSFHHKHDPAAPYAAAWLHAAAVHTALNVVRGKRRRAQRETAQAIAHLRLHAVSEAALDPQRELEESERRRDVRAALSRLPARSAEVLVLRYSGLSYAEIAAALGVKVGQIGTLLRRAEQAFQKEVARSGGC
jgi:RNA polymerase sigma-70 factor (ECF subfamily)